MLFGTVWGKKEFERIVLSVTCYLTSQMNIISINLGKSRTADTLESIVKGKYKVQDILSRAVLNDDVSGFLKWEGGGSQYDLGTQ